MADDAGAVTHAGAVRPPSVNAARPAVVMASSGEVRTFAQVEASANRLAHLWRAHGIAAGDHVAVLLENDVRYLEVIMAALRAGLVLTPVNAHLTPREIAWIVEHSEARALVVAAGRLAQLDPATTARLRHVAVVGDVDGAWSGRDDYDEALAAYPATPIADERAGVRLMYSSGSTGTPKGVLERRAHLSDLRNWPTIEFETIAPHATLGEDSVTLVPGPLYHSAPFNFAFSTHLAGGTAVVMETFDPREALRALHDHRVTHSVWTPTMLVWLARLGAEARADVDLSAHRVAVHVGAPCPEHVKRAMLDWWGPIVVEAYGGTEGIGSCMITAAEWLERPGSVGRLLGGRLSILDDDGRELPTGAVGTVYFEHGRNFDYWKDPETTARARLADDRATLGDVGRLDEAGYLYLTDRKSALIVSGGVNVYPREIEDVLLRHPDVADVAVLGVPEHELGLGEAIKAVVEPRDPTRPTDELLRELRRYAVRELAQFKRPHQYQFERELPRMPSGKLRRAELRRRYGVTA